MIKNIKSYMLLVFALVFALASCKKDEFKFGDLKTPTNVVLTTTIVGANTANPSGDGSGNVDITVTGSNALTYKVDFGDGISQLVPTGIIRYKYSNTGTFNYTITVNAIGTGGSITTVSKLVNVLVTYQPPTYVLQFLTGGSSKSWKLDPAPGANAIIVGTEGSPGLYFGGGALAPCQLTDVYSFTSTKSITYNANGQTFNGGNVAPNYNCSTDRSYANQSYSYSAVANGVAGLTTIKLPGVPPTRFIGTTDVPSENIYRILDITATTMLLRAGDGTGTVFTFKFIAL